MNYQALLYFRTAAQVQHFTRAAKQLNLTQPALSKAIKNLESELGVPLFYKSGRGVVLTAYGEVFYKSVCFALNEIEDAVVTIDQMQKRKQNNISISALFSMYADFLPDCIIEFRRAYKKASFQIEYKVTSSILQDILSGKLTFGICSDFETDLEQYDNIEYKLLWKEKLKLIVPLDHQLAEEKKVRIEELRNEHFIVYRKTPFGINCIIEKMCQDAGFVRDIVMEGFNDYSVLGLVAAGEGVAVISERTPMDLNKVALLDFDTPQVPMRSIYLIYNKDANLTQAEKEFLRFLVSRVEKEQ